MSKTTPKQSNKPATTQVRFVEVGAEYAGQRLDNFLMRLLKGVPKSMIYRIIRKGEVRVNKGRAKQTTKLQQGDSVRIPPVRVAQKQIASIDPQRFEFLKQAILYEDQALLVLNKPSGMAVHAGSGIKHGVIEALRSVRDDLSYIELAHRLDRETSGCLVLAKKASALKALNDDFKNNSLKNARLDKRYLTLVKGRWQFGQRRVTKPLNVEARKNGERTVVVDKTGRYASSIMTPQAVSDVASLLEVKLLTGRTHQVRVHAQSEGHPVAGDQRYGDGEFNQQLKKLGLTRLFLHACRLSLIHPISKQSMSFEAPLAEDLQEILKQLTL